MRKSISTMEHRAKAVSALSLSFRERTIFLSFYVLSIPLYLHSTLLPTSSLLQHYTRIIRKVLCPRPWVQAEHLPGIVRYLKLGILHCPQISLLASLLGYCVRCYGENIATWLCFISPALPPMPEQLQQGLVRIRSALVEANPYTVSSFVESVQKHNSLPNHKFAKKLTSALKARVSFLTPRPLSGIESHRFLGFLPLVPRYWMSYTLLLSKPFPAIHVLPCCDGLLIPSRTFTSALDHTCRGPPLVSVDVGNFLLFIQVVSLLEPSTPLTCTLTCSTHCPSPPCKRTSFHIKQCTCTHPFLLRLYLLNGLCATMRSLNLLTSSLLPCPIGVLSPVSSVALVTSQFNIGSCSALFQRWQVASSFGALGKLGIGFYLLIPHCNAVLLLGCLSPICA